MLQPETGGYYTLSTRILAAREWAGGGEWEGGPLPEKKDEGCDALGWCRHCIRVGMDSYQHPSVAYGSGRKPAKVLGMNPANPSPRGSGRSGLAGKNAMGDALGAGLY